MNDEIGILRDKLEELIQITESLTDYKVIYLSQELDKLISNYYLQNARDGAFVSNELTLIDEISSDGYSNFKIVENKMQIKNLYEKKNLSLKDSEKVVIQMRYGIPDGIPLTQRENSLILGISKSYVSRIEKLALKRINRELKDTNG